MDVTPAVVAPTDPVCSALGAALCTDSDSHFLGDSDGDLDYYSE